MIKRPKSAYSCIECSKCLNRHRCLRASSLSTPERQFFISYLGYHKEPNKLMLLGTQTHEEFFKMYPTIEQIGATEFIKKVYSGEEVIVKELGICGNGLRGHMDLVKIKYYPEKKTFNIDITELKPKFNKEYLKQLSAYGTIWNTHSMLFHYTIKGPRSENILALPFYERDGNYIINVTGKLIYYKYPNQFLKKWLVKENIFVDKGYFAMNWKIKKFRKLMECKEIYLHNLKMCDEKLAWCENCSYRWLCIRNLYSKDVQYHMGKRKVIKRSK